MKRIVAFVYGIACYGVFFATLLYAIGFLGNFGVPKSIDSGRVGSTAAALAIDGALLALFALQHSIMARPWFKRAWTRIVPEPVERSTYVLFSSLALLLMFWQWQPIGGIIWKIEGGIARTIILGLYMAGVLVVLLSTFLINHFDLFGLRQVYLYLVGRKYTHTLLLSLHPAPALFRVAADVLVGAGHDRGPPVLCRHDDCLHPAGDPLRRGRPDHRSRREVPAIPQAGSDVGAGAGSERDFREAGGAENRGELIACTVRRKARSKCACGLLRIDRIR
jgi:protein-S-isoprenylcysteine O-methyltransferase Ste14